MPGQRRGKRLGPLAGDTSEANELADWLRDLTAGMTMRELEEKFRYSRTQWSECLRGRRLIPKDLIGSLVAEQIREPWKRPMTKLRGEELLEAAEAAANAAGRPAASADGLQLRFDVAEALKKGRAAESAVAEVTRMYAKLFDEYQSLDQRFRAQEQNADQARVMNLFAGRGDVQRDLSAAEEMLGKAKASLEGAEREREEAEELRRGRMADLRRAQERLREEMMLEAQQRRRGEHRAAEAGEQQDVLQAKLSRGWPVSGAPPRARDGTAGSERGERSQEQIERGTTGLWFRAPASSVGETANSTWAEQAREQVERRDAERLRCGLTTRRVLYMAKDVLAAWGAWWTLGADASVFTYARWAGPGPSVWRLVLLAVVLLAAAAITLGTAALIGVVGAKSYEHNEFTIFLVCFGALSSVPTAVIGLVHPQALGFVAAWGAVVAHAVF
jgi:hypothetical protein